MIGQSAALAILAGYLGVTLWFFPLTASLLPLLNLWFPSLPALFLIYPGIHKRFQIAETLRMK